MYKESIEREPKIVLNYSGSYFTAGNFGSVERNGDYLPVFLSQDANNNTRSMLYFVANMDKTEAVNLGGKNTKYLSAQNYIMVEKGIRGFDFESRLFICSTTKSEAGFTITVTESGDEKLRTEMWEIMQMNFRGAKDAFNESIANLIIPSGNTPDNISYEALAKRTFNRIKETRFLDIDPNDKSYSYICLDDSYGRCLNVLKMQCKNGHFTPCEPKSLIDMSVNDMGLLFQKEVHDENSFTILKAEDLVHDTLAKLWLKARILYNYPQDSESIKNAFPLLLEENTNNGWRHIEPMSDKDSLALSPANLGDKVLWLPCFGLFETHLGVKKDEPFTFMIRDCGLSVDFGPAREYLICTEYGVSFINHAGREFFALYRSGEKRRVKKDIYISYGFYKLVPLSDVLSVTVESCNGWLSALCWGYYFHTLRNGLISKPVDGEVFDSLYMAAPVDMDKDNLSAKELI